MTNQTFSNGYALLIGIGADLPVTVQDATALHNILIYPGKAAYSKEQVVLLTETSATRLKILAAFDSLIEQVSHNPEATVIVYYSGHGVKINSPDGEKYFLVPYGFKMNNLEDTAISGKEFTEKIEAINARNIMSG
ncbi:caspase family protein [Okeania sp. KiyG1]|uniref:caspase family protein n=1 Tax=Okeania sp. KiyG1 TaxID=2720165 RepID=UPI001920A990|nr:caspase family protein [Okeania sp. KiyG1]GGA20710.1 hypothetical protein CYANOKiyG1_35690 [Okeania sp. KiyG1]